MEDSVAFAKVKRGSFRLFVCSLEWMGPKMATKLIDSRDHGSNPNMDSNLGTKGSESGAANRN